MLKPFVCKYNLKASKSEEPREEVAVAGLQRVEVDGVEISLPGTKDLCSAIVPLRASRVDLTFGEPPPSQVRSDPIRMEPSHIQSEPIRLRSDTAPFDPLLLFLDPSNPVFRAPRLSPHLPSHLAHSRPISSVQIRVAVSSSGIDFTFTLDARWLAKSFMDAVGGSS